MTVRMAWQRRSRRFEDVLLWPVALIVVILEDVVWVAARAFLRRISGSPPLSGIARWLAWLPGWAALPFFAVPELLGRVGEFWAFVLLAHRHWIAGVAAWIVVRGAATLIVLFIYQSCEPALMRLEWFAWVIGRARAARDWARARLAPAMARLRAAFGVSRGHTVIRFRALVRHLERKGIWPLRWRPRKQ